MSTRRVTAGAAIAIASLLLISATQAQRGGRQRSGASRPNARSTPECEAPNLLRDCRLTRTAAATPPETPAAPPVTLAAASVTPMTPPRTPAAPPLAPAAAGADDPATAQSGAEPVPDADWTRHGDATITRPARGVGLILPPTDAGAWAEQLLTQPLQPGADYVLLARLLRIGPVAPATESGLDLLLAPHSLAHPDDGNPWRIGGIRCTPGVPPCNAPSENRATSDARIAFRAPLDADERPYLILAALPDAAATALAVVDVRLYRIPAPRFSREPACGPAPLRVSFQASGNGTPGLEWRWSFGDGGTATGNPVRHVYRRGGVFTPTVRLEGALVDDRAPRAASAEMPPAPATTVRVEGAPPMQPLLYWSDEDLDGRRRIVRARLDGLEVEVLRPVAGEIGGIAVDSGAARLYWTETDPAGGAAHLLRSDLAGCTREVLHEVAGAAEGFGDLAVDESSGLVYWADLDAGAILRGSTAAAADDFVAEVARSFGADEPLRPRGIGTDPTAARTAWVSEGDLSTVGAIELLDPGASGLTLTAEAPFDIAVHRRALYLSRPTAGLVERLAPGPDAVERRALCEACGRPLELAVDRAGRRLYWLDGDGSLRGMFTARGTPGTIIVDLLRPRGLALYEPAAVRP